MSFNTLARIFRVTAKPGVKSYSDQNPSLPLNQPIYGLGDNADPLSDPVGCQWVRDASDPQAYEDSSTLGELVKLGYPERQIWTFLPNLANPANTVYFVGQVSNGGGGTVVGRPMAVYNVEAFAEAIPATAWDLGPLYVQLHAAPVQNVGPVLGAVPLFTIPIPRPPSIASVHFGVKTPLNSVNALLGGIAVCLSSTGPTYTEVLPAVATFGVNINWAYYSQNTVVIV